MKLMRGSEWIHLYSRNGVCGWLAFWVELLKCLVDLPVLWAIDTRSHLALDVTSAAAYSCFVIIAYV